MCFFFVFVHNIYNETRIEWKLLAYEDYIYKTRKKKIGKLFVTFSREQQQQTHLRPPIRHTVAVRLHVIPAIILNIRGRSSSLLAQMQMHSRATRCLVQLTK